MPVYNTHKHRHRHRHTARERQTKVDAICDLFAAPELMDAIAAT